MFVKIMNTVTQIWLEKYKRILKNNPGEKSMKVSFIIYADTKSLLEKINICHNNPEN